MKTTKLLLVGVQLTAYSSAIYQEYLERTTRSKPRLSKSNVHGPGGSDRDTERTSKMPSYIGCWLVFFGLLTK